MEKLFVPYEIALKLKEKGFDEPCFGFYHTKNISPNKKETTLVKVIVKNHNEFSYQECSAPIYQQVIDFFREKQNIRIVDEINGHTRASYDLSTKIKFSLIKIDGGGSKDLQYGNGRSEYNWYSDYYEALNKAIEEALKLI